jgi:hypothetical protein
MRQDIRVLQIRQRLIKAAKNRKRICYGEFINNQFYCVARGQGQPHKIGNVLGEICDAELAATPKRPLLSAICVLKSNGMPSSGFWGYLGLSDNATDEEKRQKWEPERDRVFSYWQTHDI